MRVRLKAVFGAAFVVVVWCGLVLLLGNAW